MDEKTTCVADTAVVTAKLVASARRGSSKLRRSWNSPGSDTMWPSSHTHASGFGVAPVTVPAGAVHWAARLGGDPGVQAYRLAVCVSKTYPPSPTACKQNGV